MAGSKQARRTFTAKVDAPALAAVTKAGQLPLGSECYVISSVYFKIWVFYAIPIAARSSCLYDPVETFTPPCAAGKKVISAG